MHPQEKTLGRLCPYSNQITGSPFLPELWGESYQWMCADHPLFKKQPSLHTIPTILNEEDMGENYSGPLLA